MTEPIQFRVGRTDGTYRYAEAVVSNLRDRPSVAGYVGNLRDITERKEAESLLAHVALHDPLTGLPNRPDPRPGRPDARALPARAGPVAALFVDLDNFKDINDSLGHDAGDKVLRAVAGRFVGTCARATPSGASAATSSSSWPKGRHWGRAPRWSPSASTTRCASRSGSRASTVCRSR